MRGHEREGGGTGVSIQNKKIRKLKKIIYRAFDSFLYTLVII